MSVFGLRRMGVMGGLLLLSSAMGIARQEQDPAQEVSFARDVLPIMRAQCQACHQPAKAEGGIILMNHAQLLVSIDEMPLVVPGKPEESLLLDLIIADGDTPPEMPVDRPPLTEQQVELIKRWIAAGAPDDSIAEDGHHAPELYPRPPVVTSLAFSPDGNLLAVSGRGEVLLHEVGDRLTPSPAGRLAGLSERIESIAFSPDGKRLAVAGGSPGLQGEVQIWSVAKAELLLSLAVTYDTLRGISWSHDGTRVAFGGKDNSLRIIDAQSGEQLLYQGAHSDWVLDTTFSSDDSHLVSVGRDRSMKLSLVSSQQFIDNITSITPGALKGGLMTVERHPSKDELLIGGADGLPKIYRMYREKKRVIGDDYNLIRAFDRLPGRVFCATWDPAGERVAIAGGLRDAGLVRVHEVAEGKQLWERKFPSSIYTADYDPTGSRLAVGGFEGLVWVLSTETGSVINEFIPVPMAAQDQ
ncbi:MAG: hypothetical protein ACI9HE_002236 [Planctomycetota bacterium]|jgi:DNA-binding beta-propeller fold protein YncE